MSEITLTPSVEILQNSGLEIQTREAIERQMLPFLVQANEWRETAEALIVTDETQVDLMKQAREARLALRSIRIEADKVRKNLKEDSLRYGKAVQSVYNLIEENIAPIEKHLETQEKFVEIQERNKMLELLAERQGIVDNSGLRAFIPDAFYTTLGAIGEDDFASLMEGATLKFKAKAEADKEAKLKEQRDAEEREALRKENQRLKEEADVLRRQQQASIPLPAPVPNAPAVPVIPKRLDDRKTLRDFAQTLDILRVSNRPQFSNGFSEQLYDNALGLLAKVSKYIVDNTAQMP